MPQPTPVTRSRLAFVAVAVWAAILAGIIAVGLVLGGRGASNATTLAAAGAPGAVGANLLAPLAADPSASPSAGASTAPGKTNDNDGGLKGPGGFAHRVFGRGGFGPGAFGHDGGPGGPGRGRGPISIAAVNGSQLSLKTDDGWSRTIDAAGATITEQGGTAITLGDLKVGDQIGFRQTRNADGTYKVTDIVRIPAQTGGVVKSVDATSATLTLPDGTTKTITLNGSTTYNLKGKAATAADLKAGTRIHATGTVDASGNFTATKVAIAPAVVGGTVTARSSTTITIKDRSGAAVTINVDGSTTYRTRGKDAGSLADIADGDIVLAEGTLSGDGSLNATTVLYGTPGPKVFGGPHRGHDGPANPADPNASPAPSGNAG